MENTYNLFSRIGLFVILSIMIAVGSLVPSIAAADSNVSVWWPGDGATLTGAQPLKAMVPGLDVTSYELFWQVDGGSWNWMDNNYQDYPHKETSADVSSWNWHGSGPYVVNFIARQNGAVIAQQSVSIYINNGQPRSAAAPVSLSVAPVVVLAAAASVSVSAPISVPSAPASPATTTTSVTAATTSPTTAQTTVWLASAQAVASSTPVSPTATSTASITTAVPAASSSPIATTAVSTSTVYLVPNVPAAVSVPQLFSGARLYVALHSNAVSQAAAWSGNNPSGAQAMALLAAQPTAAWFGNWNSDIKNDVHSLVSAAQSSGTMPVLVAYDIPQRDCGGFSSGGTDNPGAYQSWIQSFVAGIGNAPAIVILEPDALAEIGCLSASDQQTRLQLLSSAVVALKSNPQTKVYIDAGHSNWVGASDMAKELSAANISQADGFSLNVSNFMPTGDEVAYGQAVSSLVANKHFVIDTSRNGNGSNGQWCNPSGRAVGEKPTLSTGKSLVDAYLWLKTPGESDGSCNGGPSAGVWWPQYAFSLVQNSH